MLAAIKYYFMLWNMKNDLPAACNFKKSLTINCESTWPGLMLHLTRLSTSRIKPVQQMQEHTPYSKDSRKIGVVTRYPYREIQGRITRNPRESHEQFRESRIQLESPQIFKESWNQGLLFGDSRITSTKIYVANSSYRHYAILFVT